MTIRVNQWYRVKETGQYCRIQRIPSATDPRVSVPKADENTRGFELALEWYSPPIAPDGSWSKRVMILGVKKACTLFRELTDADERPLEMLKSLAPTLPVASASRDGELTLPPRE